MLTFTTHLRHVSGEPKEYEKRSVDMIADAMHSINEEKH